MPAAIHCSSPKWNDPDARTPICSRARVRKLAAIVYDAVASAVDRHVGKRLRMHREQKGISQKRLDEAGGVAMQQIQKYECAVNRISPSRLYRFARLLGVPVAWFFDGLPPTT